LRAIVWRRAWVRVERSFAPMMLSIICMLAPTHWTKFVWATKSFRSARSIRNGLAAAGVPPGATAAPDGSAAQAVAGEAGIGPIAASDPTRSATRASGKRSSRRRIVAGF
jgi:hypothetical protein